MYNEKEIEDSLAFCKNIEIYRQADQEMGVGEPPEAREESAAVREEKMREFQWELSRLEQEAPARRPTTESASLKAVNNVFMLAVCLLLGFFIASLITHFVAYQTRVEGQSMEPTLSDGDSVIIQKLSYIFGEPERFDVVVFPVKAKGDGKNGEDSFYVKRIIGLPGETLQVRDGAVYIDGERLESDNYCLSKMLDGGNADDPVTIREDEYFVLGDNRNMSTDSRNSYVGMVKKKDISGKVFLRIWPFTHFGLLSGKE